jgi:hypothetical protein
MHVPAAKIHEGIIHTETRIAADSAQKRREQQDQKLMRKVLHDRAVRPVLPTRAERSSFVYPTSSVGARLQQGCVLDPSKPGAFIKPSAVKADLLRHAMKQPMHMPISPRGDVKRKGLPNFYGASLWDNNSSRPA